MINSFGAGNAIVTWTLVREDKSGYNQPNNFGNQAAANPYPSHIKHHSIFEFILFIEWCRNGNRRGESWRSLSSGRFE